MPDALAWQAREHHRRAADAGQIADRHRQQRDTLVRQLRAGDPARWTYTALARAVGCSPELIAYIIRTTPSDPELTADGAVHTPGHG